jgi:hypothetical protein
MIELASGRLAKMLIEKTEPLSYYLNVGDEKIDMNAYIGKDISIISNGEIRCSHCQRKTNKSFNQGYCFPCFKKLAQCDRCMMSPELCHFSKGTCREPEWAEQFCMQEHIVYLANSSGLKVGITRHTQVPTRWMDQGAIQALPIISVSTRQLSGLVEVIMKEWVADKTNWRKMLKHDVEVIDLMQERDKLFDLSEGALSDLKRQFPDEQINKLENAEMWQFEYPSLQWPEKIKTFNLEKQSVVEGKLLAIKGQYLILDSGCFNVRKHSSFDVLLSAD